MTHSLWRVWYSSSDPGCIATVSNIHSNSDKKIDDMAKELHSDRLTYWIPGAICRTGITFAVEDVDESVVLSELEKSSTSSRFC